MNSVYPLKSASILNQVPGVSSVYLIALSVGHENHHPLDLSDRWIYQELRAPWRRFIQLEHPHGERIGLRLLQSEFAFHAYVAMLGTFNSDGEVTLTLLEKPLDNFSDLVCPFFSFPPEYHDGFYQL